MNGERVIVCNDCDSCQQKVKSDNEPGADLKIARWETESVMFCLGVLVLLCIPLLFLFL